MSKRLIVANWKMNPQTLDEARRIASQIEHGLLTVDRDKVEVAICPPFVFLPIVKHAVHFAKVGAQNMAAEEKGPFTGEVSSLQLREFNVSFLIIGHSERRAMGESDQQINRKVKLALKNELFLIVCVGFGTAKKSSEGTVKRIVKKQLAAALQDLRFGKDKIAIAYEPVWAISRGLGTGQAVNPEHAARLIKYIKSLYPKTRVIYGGSVDAKNASGFAEHLSIEGALVGGASLHPLEFLQIIKTFVGP